MTWEERYFEPTGEDCQNCKGTGKDPKKRERDCPVLDCHGGKMWKIKEGVDKL